jgi:hypothetical protein
MRAPRSVIVVTRTAFSYLGQPIIWKRHSCSALRTAAVQTSWSKPIDHARQTLRTKGSQSAGASTRADASNPAIAFPCLDALETKSAKLEARSFSSGPEPSYTSGATAIYNCKEPMVLDWGGILPEFDIAYEMWRELNPEMSNVILLHTGLSASSHAHSTPSNLKPGWWEEFIGPGDSLDTKKYYIIYTNVVGGCY